MMEKINKLTEVQLRATRKIAMGIGFDEIASELSINRATLYRWRKLPHFAYEVTHLVDAVKEESRERVVRDVSEINDIVLSTLLDVAQNDSSGSARVSAARALTEMVQKAGERTSDNDVMKDQSSEIKALLQLIQKDSGNVIQPSV
jgi:transposase-like protein